MKTVAQVLGVSRSNLAERLKGKSPSRRGPLLKADDAAAACHSQTCGSSADLWLSGIAALLNGSGEPPISPLSTASGSSHHGQPRHDP